MKRYQVNYKALGYKSKISIKTYRFIYSGVKSPLPVVTIEFKKKKEKKKTTNKKEKKKRKIEKKYNQKEHSLIYLICC